MTVEPVPDSETSKGAALRPLVQCERPAYVVLVRLLFPVDTEVLLKTISLYLWAHSTSIYINKVEKWVDSSTEQNADADEKRRPGTDWVDP